MEKIMLENYFFFSFYEKKFETADKWDLKLKFADDHKEALNWMVTENHPR